MKLQKVYTPKDVITATVAYIEKQTDVEDDLIQALAEFGIELPPNAANALIGAQKVIRDWHEGKDPHLRVEELYAAESVLDSIAEVYGQIAEAQA